MNGRAFRLLDGGKRSRARIGRMSHMPSWVGRAVDRGIGGSPVMEAAIYQQPGCQGWRVVMLVDAGPGELEPCPRISVHVRPHQQTPGGLEGLVRRTLHRAGLGR
jgi:hypothetical protein